MPEIQWHEHHGVTQDRGLMSFAHHHGAQPDGVMVRFLTNPAEPP